jgi:transcriptional regulator with PAS, ATPase and Fis domain
MTGRYWRKEIFVVTPQIALDSSPLARIVGASPLMRDLHRLVARMSRSRFPVLIQGETGTGKEVVASAIHDLAPAGPFVVVDCSALVGPLMESELFGYAKGAFTGAHTQKLGLLDAANGGTAFFDEIGELPLDLQVKLLRVLQEKQFRAVGGLAPRTSNFRVIAATNRDLAAEVKAGRFRQDLYYRLNVMKLRLPPLRERKEDIPVLVGHFLQRYGNGHRIPDDVMSALVNFDWPGNVRQLEHTVQQIVAMNSGPWISMADLPSAVINRRAETAILAGSPPPEINAPAEQEIVPLVELERRAIARALERTRNDRTLAAAMLGIGRTTLYRKIKSYGL